MKQASTKESVATRNNRWRPFLQASFNLPLAPLLRLRLLVAPLPRVPLQ
jgi:hypothetical protein